MRSNKIVRKDYETASRAWSWKLYGKMQEFFVLRTAGLYGGFSHRIRCMDLKGDKSFRRNMLLIPEDRLIVHKTQIKEKERWTYRNCSFTAFLMFLQVSIEVLSMISESFDADSMFVSVGSRAETEEIDFKTPSHVPPSSHSPCY